MSKEIIKGIGEHQYGYARLSNSYPSFIDIGGVRIRKPVLVYEMLGELFYAYPLLETDTFNEEGEANPDALEDLVFAACMKVTEKGIKRIGKHRADHVRPVLAISGERVSETKVKFIVEGTMVYFTTYNNPQSSDPKS